MSEYFTIEPMEETKEIVGCADCGGEYHSCPFEQDVNDDQSDYCNCCEVCTENCRENI